MQHNLDTLTFTTDPPPIRKHPLAKCEACPLYNRPCAPSSGPTSPVLAVVGEAPGLQEARQHKPFVGPSGQLLDATLNLLGVDPAQVFKTNAVLCQPLDNADPPSSAVVACQERLRSELGALGDVSIVAAGAVATASLDALHGYRSAEGIMKRRGTSVTFPLVRDGNTDIDNAYGGTIVERRYYPVLHPAYVLRQPNAFEMFRADLQRIVNPYPVKDWLAIEYIELTRDNFNVYYDEFDALDNGTLLAIDTETKGLRWWQTPTTPAAQLINIVFAFDLDRAFIVPAELVPFVRNDLQALFNRCHVVTHNGQFDAQILQNAGIQIDISHDTMLASFTLNELKGYHRLKYLATQFLNVPDYERKILGDAFLSQPSEDRDYSGVPLDKLYKYAAIDACVTLALHREFIPRLIADDVARAYDDVLIPGAETVITTERNGIKIDRPYLEKLKIYIERDLQQITDEIWTIIEGYANKTLNHTLVMHTPYYKEKKILVGPNAIIPRGKAGLMYKRFNPNSFSQIGYVLYSLFELKHVKQLGYKTPPTSTNAEALDALPPHPIVIAMRKYRRAAKMLSTYVNTLLDIADTNDRVHVRYNLNGTEIGRLSADDSLHGIPRPEDFYGKALRGAFIADEGNVLVVADYGQAELRTIAADSKEPFFLAAFNLSDAERHQIASERYPDLYAGYDEHRRDLLARLATDLHCQTAVFLFPDYEQEELANIARGVFGEGRAKRLRTYAKNFNFGTVYQGGPEGIWSMTGGALQLALVRQLQERHKARTPVLTQYCLTQFRFAKTHGYVQTRFGRKRRFPLLTADNIGDVRKASVHMPTASGASDLTLLSGYTATQRGLILCHMVHDSLILECKREDAPAVASQVREIMIAIGNEYYPEVQWEADVDISTRWYEDRPALEDL